MLVYLEDKRLVNRLLKGDERAFDQFFNDNFSRLYRFAQARMPNDAAAIQEVVHAVLTKAMAKIETYRGESALFTWVCVICRNEIIDWARRNEKYNQHIVLTEDFPEIQAAVDSFRAPETTNPVQHYQRFEATRLVQVALDKLPPRYGDALEWKYIEGYSVKEIAQKMALSPDAVQSLLARARKAFEDIYSTMVRTVLEPISADETS